MFDGGIVFISEAIKSIFRRVPVLFGHLVYDEWIVLGGRQSDR